MSKREIDDQSTESSYSEEPETSGMNAPTAGSQEDASDLSDLYWHSASGPGKLLASLSPEVKDPQVLAQLKSLLFIVNVVPRFLPGGARSVLERYAHLTGVVEGDSVLLEWVFPDFRVGFNIEPNREESGWYFVSDKNLHEGTSSGHIGSMRDTLAMLLGHIRSNV